jgi:hypothetical protein
VKKYALAGQSASQVTELGSQTLTDVTVAAVGGVTTMTYTKPLVETGEVPLNTDTTTILIFAYGSSSTALGYHAGKAVAKVNLKTCETETVKIKTMSSFNIFCHAALMIGAWAWLIPSGILTAVYKEKFGPGWIKLHIPLQVQGPCGNLYVSARPCTTIATNRNTYKVGCVCAWMRSKLGWLCAWMRSKWVGCFQGVKPLPQPSNQATKQPKQPNQPMAFGAMMCGFLVIYLP